MPGSPGTPAAFDTPVLHVYHARPEYEPKSLHVAIVGATGAVGIEMIKTLEKRNFPVGKLTLLASARSAGKKLQFQGRGASRCRN